jgi:hypothetical protein
MSDRRLVAALIAFACVLTAGTARAQPETSAPAGAQQGPPAPSGPGASAPAASAPSAAPAAWSVSASLFTYVEPDEGDYGVYLQPTFTADRGWLHLEGRFNYEDFDTGSVWLGRNVSVGKTVTLEITPRIGAVFGNTNGVAPGFTGTLAWKTLEFYSETEYVFDAGDWADSFLYTWSEWAWALIRGWRVGLVIQREKVYKTEIEVQRGFFVGWSSDRVDLTTYVFNPGASKPTVVLGAIVRF